MSHLLSSPATDFDFPPLADLSLNSFDSSDKCWPQSLMDHTLLYSHGYNYRQTLSHYYGAPQQSLPTTGWSVGWQQFQSDLSWKASGTPPGQTMEYDSSPSSPISTTSSVSADSPPPSVHIVRCTAPLLAPKPLPYHSPTFLQFELLPDIEEDLSHPPYTQRSKRSKRKRDSTEDAESGECFPAEKRRPLAIPSHLPLPMLSRHSKHSRSKPAVHPRQNHLYNPYSYYGRPTTISGIDARPYSSFGFGVRR